MRALISADMEGITGVTAPADCALGTPEFARFQTIMTADVNAVALGLFDAGVEAVTVCEAHGSMRNVLLEQLDPRVRMITGRHKPYAMMEGIQSRPELVAFVGYHTAAGAEGILSHTMIAAPLVRAELNGVLMSEGVLNAALAGEFGANVVLVSGDDLTCADAEGYAPGAERVAVKTAIDRYTADCLHPAVTASMLREAASRAPQAPPMTPAQAPFTCEMEFSSSNAAAACASVPTVQRLDARRIRVRADLASELYRAIRVIFGVATGSTLPVYG